MKTYIMKTYKKGKKNRREREREREKVCIYSKRVLLHKATVAI